MEQNLEEIWELEDIADQADIVGKLTPREYAKLRGMAPQMVYYYIRNKVVETEHCVCGRIVVDVKAANQAIQAKKEARSKPMDPGDDCPAFD